MRRLLVNDWRHAHHWYSIHVAVIVGALSVLYDYVQVIHDVLPGGWVKYGLVLIIIARMVRQEPPSNASNQSD